MGTNPYLNYDKHYFYYINLINAVDLLRNTESYPLWLTVSFKPSASLFYILKVRVQVLGLLQQLWWPQRIFYTYGHK